MFPFVLLSALEFCQAQTSPQITAWHAMPPVAWGQLTHGWQLALFAEKQSYFTGEPVKVALVGRNGNSATIGVGVNRSGWYIAEFEIRRLGDGEVMKQRPPKDTTDRLRRASGSVREARIAPGATARFGVVDLRMYDLTPETYTVTAIFKFPNPADRMLVPVRSNEITVSIIAR